MVATREHPNDRPAYTPRSESGAIWRCFGFPRSVANGMRTTLFHSVVMFTTADARAIFFQYPPTAMGRKDGDTEDPRLLDLATPRLLSVSIRATCTGMPYGGPYSLMLEGGARCATNLRDCRMFTPLDGFCQGTDPPH